MIRHSSWTRLLNDDIFKFLMWSSVKKTVYNKFAKENKISTIGIIFEDSNSFSFFSIDILMLKLLMQMRMNFEIHFNITNTIISNYWWSFNLRNMSALIEQSSRARVNIIEGKRQPQGIIVRDVCDKQKFQDWGYCTYQEPLPISIHHS